MVPLSIRKYLDALPDGAASYPECCVKASVLRNVLASRPLGPEVDLPPEIRKLVEDPLMVGDWISEVQFNAAMLAIRETHFNSRSLHDYSAWIRELNQKLLGTPLYRMLFLLVSPDRLLNGIERRWSAFRRGSEIKVIDRGVNTAKLRVTYPAFLYSSVAIEGLIAAFQAGMEHAGAKRSSVDAVTPTSTESVYSVSW